MLPDATIDLCDSYVADYRAGVIDQPQLAAHLDTVAEKNVDEAAAIRQRFAWAWHDARVFSAEIGGTIGQPS